MANEHSMDERIMDLEERVAALEFVRGGQIFGIPATASDCTLAWHQDRIGTSRASNSVLTRYLKKRELMDAAGVA